MTLPSEYDNKLWLALLNEIILAGGEIKPSEVYPRIREYFPEISEQDLAVKNASGGNKWTNQIQWVRQHLAERGCIDQKAHGLWKITPIGQTWFQQYWKGKDTDYSSVKKPPKVASSKKLSKQPAKQQPRQEKEPILKISEIVDPVTRLCDRLVKTQRLSDSFEEFEFALRDAFTFLGFDAKHIGGPSETDVLLQTHLGKDSYRVIIDAKTTRSGRVSDSQINWPVLGTHRRQNEADYAVVIGEDFTGGNLKRFAEEYKVTLIRTKTLCDVLKMHHVTPFGLLELREMFEEYSLSTSALDSLQRRHGECLRHWKLLIEIVEQVEAYNRHVPAGLLPKADSLHLMMMQKVISGEIPADEAPSLMDIQEALGFLACSAVAILRKVPGSDEAYQLVMNSETARHRLSGLASAVTNLKTGLANSSNSSVEQMKHT